MSKKNGNCPLVRAAVEHKRLKLLMWGPEGSGKTITACQFPNPIVIDTEGGTDHYRTQFGLSPDHNLSNTSDPNAIMETVDWLLTNEHDFRTLIIDPITIYWAALQKKYEDILGRKKNKGKTEEHYQLQFSDWSLIKGELRKLIRKLTDLDMSVIATAHQKKEYADGQMAKVIGETFDGEKSLPYMFDVIIRLHGKQDGKFMASCVKDRTGTLPPGKFEMSYSVFEKALGGETLTRKAAPIMPATQDQKDQLERDFIHFSMTEDQIHRLLVKCGADGMDSLTAEQAGGMVTKFKEKREQEAA